MAKSKKWIWAKNINISRTMNLSQLETFFPDGARQTFIKLRQIFIEASILNHFNLEDHICIQIDTFSYMIGRILSQLTSDELGQWYLVDFFSKKMIFTEI